MFLSAAGRRPWFLRYLVFTLVFALAVFALGFALAVFALAFAFSLDFVEVDLGTCDYLHSNFNRFF
jgi:hypothetical protein